MQLDRPGRSAIESLTAMRLPTASGGQVSIAEVTDVKNETIDVSRYGKNLRPVVYVLGDVAGEVESPVYAIMKMNEAIDKLKTPQGYAIKRYNAEMPTETDRLTMKWDGEWHITIEVFRDLGLAFAAVLVLIYVLVVGWFRSFLTPLVIMAPIPLTLVGILPAHMLMGAFFTATSMIGFIAGAGIIVRNSIILVDFIELRRAQGMPSGAGGGGRGSGALPSDAADGGGGRGGCERDTVRPDLPGTGTFADGRRGGLDAAVAHDRARAVLHGGKTQTTTGATCWSARQNSRRCIHDRRTRSANDCGSVCAALARPWLLRLTLLVPVHRVRRPEPVPIGVYQLVPDDDHPEEGGTEVGVEISQDAKTRSAGWSDSKNRLPVTGGRSPWPEQMPP